MKKVLLITRPISPPWDEASKNFAYYLSKNVTDIEFGILTSQFLEDMPANIRQLSIYTSCKFTYIQKIRLVRNLRKIKNDFDILHYIFTPTKQNSFLLKHFINYKKKPEVRTIQTIATLREDIFKDSDFKNLLFADLIITYSDYAKNKLNDLGFKNVKRVYPGIDLDAYNKISKDLDLMKYLDLNHDDFIVIFPGEYSRLGTTDDIVNLIKKYHVEMRKRNIKIIFPGRLKDDKDIKKREAVIKTLKKLNISDVARTPLSFNSPTKDMRQAFNTSDLAIFPVRNMNGKFDIPLVIPEAYACECPVILSDLPILKELSNGKNCEIVPIGDIDKLWEKILELYENPDKRRAMGAEAKKFTGDNFDILKISEIYKKIYEIL